MLQTHKGITNPSIVALKPRQVMLANLNMKHNNNNKGSTETLGNGSTDKTLTLKPHRNSLLLHSILQYLESNGFSKTLKSFRSEAQIENDGWKGCSLDLEELCCKYLETGNHANTNLNGHKGQDLLMDGSTKNDGDGNCVAFVETVNKKKKKRSDESDSNTVVNQSGTANKSTNGENTKEILTNDVIPQLNVKAKEKKKRKKISDSLGQGIEQVSSETLKEPADDIVCELQLDESNKKSKDKKKKKTKLISESLDDNVDHQQSESLPGVTEEKSKDLLSLEGKSLTDSETNMKSKDTKKKKKNKATSDSLVDNVGECGLEDKQGPVTTKFKDIECSRDLQVVNSTVVDTYDTSLKEKNVKSKDKKKKKDGLVSGSLYGADMKVLDKGKPKGTDAKTSKEAINKENKGSKKRKRLASEENVSQPVDGVAIEESKRRKTEGSEEAKGRDQVPKENAALGNDGRAGKESKEENTFGFNESQKTFIKQLDAHANGNLEKNDGEKSSVQKTMKKQHNGSVELKTVNAFQRVKVDEVRFSDERLQDNSYWAKDGAEIGYGAKAQEVLGQVRGRDFRHEKTKKKRGSYRGGQIDLQSHSVKFDYSDDD